MARAGRVSGGRGPDGRGVSVAVLHTDITQLSVDVLVNAANERMDHIGGLAKAIVDKGKLTSLQDVSLSLLV